MTINLMQFAPIFHLVGAKMNYNTYDNTIEVVEYPKNKKTLIERAVADISKYTDVKTSEDVILFWSLVDFIDETANPLPEITRKNIFNQSNLVKNGKFIAQEVASLKVNKSWHSSDIANTCSYFGDECVKRGVIEVKGKRGRKATRQPNEYHVAKASGIIAREQLTTSHLEALWQAIPKEVMTSATKPKEVITLEALSKLSKEKLEELLVRVKEEMK